MFYPRSEYTKVIDKRQNSNLDLSDSIAPPFANLLYFLPQKIIVFDCFVSEKYLLRSY